MRDVFGLLVALGGLFLVWVWATGRSDSVWKALVGGSTATANAVPTFNPASVNLNLPSMPSMSTLTPASYIPTPKITVGSLIMGGQSQ